MGSPFTIFILEEGDIKQGLTELFIFSLQINLSLTFGAARADQATPRKVGAIILAQQIFIFSHRNNF
jgi:hypothetical protein